MNVSEYHRRGYRELILTIATVIALAIGWSNPQPAAVVCVFCCWIGFAAARIAFKI